MPGRIVLTGTTGGLGSSVLSHLLRLNLLPPSSLIVSLHNPSSASSTSLETRRGDLTDPTSLRTAFTGAETLFLVSYPSIAFEERVTAHRNAIDACKAVGVKRIVYTSLAFGGLADDSVTEVMRAHLATEAYLKASGLEWIIIREGIYAESWSLYAGFLSLEDGKEIVVPSDGGVAWVSRHDLGEATARILTRVRGFSLLASSGGLHSSQADEFVNRTILLTGPHAITLWSLATLLRSHLSRPINLRIVSLVEYVSYNRSQASSGPRSDEGFLRKWATTYEGMERGEIANVDGEIEEILGRPARGVEEIMEELFGEVSAQENLRIYAR